MDGRVVIVTGGARGQGRAEAERFVAEGARVVVADVLDDEAAATTAALGDATLAVHLDVTDAAQWARVVATTLECFGSVDVLVNNAGVYVTGTLDAIDEATFRQVLDVNLVGPFLGLRAAAAALTARGNGAVVNVASIAGLHGVSGGTAYSSSKFGLRGLTRAAALELGPLGVRVNTVLPGVVRSAMTERALEGGESALARGLPVQRVGEPEDVAAMVVWLASDAAAFVTGADFVVDGGATAGLFRR